MKIASSKETAKELLEYNIAKKIIRNFLIIYIYTLH